MHYVSDNEGINSDDEALNIIAQKADGALRDALSTFDQIVSYCGNELSYKSVIENLNILDYEYYFRVTDAIIKSDTPELLLIFDEIIENGFDGQHFIMGLAEHLRNLLVLKNESTISLMLASSKLKENYTIQASQCAPSLLMKALDICNKYDLSYKSSNNKRLHIEIALMQFGVLLNEGGGFNTQMPARENKTLEQSDKKLVEYKTPEAKAPPEPKKEAIIDKVEEKPLAPLKEAKTVENVELPKQVQLEKTDVKKETVAKEKTVLKKEDNGRKIKRISITDTLKALKEEKENNKDEVEAVIKTEFTQEVLEQVWKDFVDSYQSKSPSFSSAVGKYKPKLSDDFKIEYKVDNKIMANDILHQASLLDFLKKELKNNQITLRPILPTVNEKKRAYFDKEKFDELAKEYPGIVKLKEQLDLDFGV